MGCKIKKYILASALLALVSAPVFSQQFDWEDPRINWNWDNNRHTFTINAGYNSIVGILTRQIFNAFYTIQNSDDNSESVNLISHTPYGDYGFQYHYNTHKWMRVGMKFNADVNRANINDVTRYISYLNLMASVQFTYYNENKWRVYSGMDIGMSGLIVPHFKTFNAGLALNITPIGFSYGRAFILFAELNLGSDAIIKGGFGLRL